MKIGHLKSCFCLLILLLLAAASPSGAVPEPSCSMMLEPDATYVHPGDTFTVTVIMEPQSAEVYGCQYEVVFDPDIFEVLSQSQGPLLSQDDQPTFIVSDIFSEEGAVLYVETRYGVKTGISASDIVSTIEFRVKDPISSYGVKEFALENVTIIDSNLQITGFDLGNGKVVLIEPVVSDFTPSVTEGEAPLTVEFADNSTNAVSWAWDFDGDGVMDSEVRNPEYTYTEPGAYDVSLTVTDKLGTRDTAKETIKVRSSAVGEPSIINSVNLFPASTTPDTIIYVSVDVMDGIEVIEVKAGDVSLVEADGIWQGSISAPDKPGDYSLSITTSDAAGNTAETSVPYHVVLPEGGVGISISPRLSAVTAEKGASLAIKVKNAQNIDGIFNVRINVDGLPESRCADLSGFSWTECEVKLRAGEEKILPLEVEAPLENASGFKLFKANVDSETSSVHGSDKGYLVVLRKSK